MELPRRCRRLVSNIETVFQQSLGFLRHAVVVTGTLPYYRFFQFNTLGPIQRIAEHSQKFSDFPRLLMVLARWRQRKLAELQYISIACAILLGAAIGTFSWNNVDTAYWLARACWYATLVIAILGILLSAQQVTVLSFLGDIPKSAENKFAGEIVDRYLPLLVSGARALHNQSPTAHRTSGREFCRPKMKMVFIWQCPIMFMSYSTCFFLIGLTVHAITPLIKYKEQGWTDGATVAIIYLAIAAISIMVFIYSAFWVYHYLDLCTDTIVHDQQPHRSIHEANCETPSFDSNRRTLAVDFDTLRWSQSPHTHDTAIAMENEESAFSQDLFTRPGGLS